MTIKLTLRRLFGSIIWYGIFYFADFWPSCQLVFAQFLETTKDFLILLGVTFSFCLIYFPLFLLWRFYGMKAYLALRTHIPIGKIDAVSKVFYLELKNLWDYIGKSIEKKNKTNHKEGDSQSDSGRT